MSTAPKPPSPSATTGRQKLLLILFGMALVVVLLGVIEAALAVADLGDPYLSEDPFVGFAPGRDLFERTTDSADQPIYATRGDKLALFNEQRFAARKPKNGYRIFALGGSTTAGRPYDSRVAFARWLELYLGAADPSRTWEVINAGAISYASYRIAILMKELVRYEPDLIVVYTGHNEFLEERTYADILDRNTALTRIQSWLSGFRFFTLARQGWQSFQDPPETRDELPAEVDAKLDGWTALELYRRDDAQHRATLDHFEHNLRQIAGLAKRRGIAVVFVKPISNVRDFSPFKSEHADSLDAHARAAHAAELQQGKQALAAGNLELARQRLQAAVELDPLYAEGWYRLGRAHLAAGRAAPAAQALLRAKDLDVAPLRALEDGIDRLVKVAGETGTPLIDLPRLLDPENVSAHDHPLLGDEVLLDHVHPDVPVHSLIAEEVLTLLVERGIARPVPAWGESRRREIYEREMRGLDRAYYAQRDLNLAKVLGWSGKLEEAEKPLLRAAEVLPENPEVRLNLGIIHQRNGRPREALGELESAAELAPEMPEAHFNLGVTLGHLGRLEEGLAALGRAIERRPDYGEAFYNRAVLERRAGRPKEALRSLARALELRPEVPEAHLQRGRALSDLARWSEAEAAFARALELAPASAEARTQLAICLARQERFNEAEAQLARVLELAPNYAEAHYNQGVVAAQQGRREEAAAAYEKAIRHNPSHVRAHNNLGIQLASQGRPEEAQRSLSRALELDPEYAEAHFNLGVVFDQSGRPKSALEAILRALELDPDNPRFHLAAGQLYGALGENARARHHHERSGGR